MATEIKYEVPAAIQAYLSTTLNTLAVDDAVVGATIDNVADGENEMFIALEFYIDTQDSARDAGDYVAVHLLASVDDTAFNYGDGTPLVDPGTLICVFSLDAAATARYVVRTNIPIPPFDFKLMVVNKTGQAFAATGNTLKYRLYSHESQ